MNWKRLFQPLKSRKVRVALATVLAAYASECGLHLPSEILVTILGVGVALILGIAHEDNGEKRAKRHYTLPVLGIDETEPPKESK